MAGLQQEIRSLLRALGESETLAEEIDEGPIDKRSGVIALRREHRRKSARPNLFEYQAELAGAACELLAKGGRGLLALPTGAGKTRTAIYAAFGAVSGGTERIVWLAPTRELVNQAFDTADRMWSEFGSISELDLTREAQPVLKPGIPTMWFTTPQAVFGARKSQHVGSSWGGVIFDEAHQLGARTFQEAVEALLRNSTGAGFLGLSATPGRYSKLETEELVRFFDGRLLHSTLLDPNPVKVLQRWGVLSRLSFRRASERSNPNEESRIPAIVDLCADLAEEERRVIVFSGTVAGAIVTAALLRSKGIEARAIYSELEHQVRDSGIAQFGAGRVRVLTNQRLLSTGYDCPAVSDVVLGARISSPILFEQMVGRAARGPMTGGESTATIWQFDDHLELHGLPQSYYRYRDYEWV